MKALGQETNHVRCGRAAPQADDVAIVDEFQAGMGGSLLLLMIFWSSIIIGSSTLDRRSFGCAGRFELGGVLLWILQV